MRRIVLLAVLATGLVPGAARATGVTLAEGTPIRGYVHLAATGSDLRIVEVVDGLDVTVGAVPSAAGIEAQTPWTCQTSRTFVAVAGVERSVPLTVATPSCADRVNAHVPGSVGLGGNIRVSLFDEWHRGALGVDVCAIRPDGRRTCRHVVMPASQFIAHTVFRASHAGEWRIEVSDPTQAFVKPVVVVQKRYARGEPTVLSTGDSMMLNPTVALRRQLSRRARVVADVYAGSGITRPFVIDWATLPGKQVRAYRPDATVISLGMGDGRDLATPDGPVACCGPDYVAAYATRVRRIMRTYARGRKGAVVWMNEPFQRDPERWPVEGAVNAAVALAAQGLPRVRVVDLAAVMTPGGAYADDLVLDGTAIRVRTKDGIHLSPAGSRIASRLAVSALRKLGVRLR